MAISVTYTNYNGRIVAENRGGTETLFLPDTLGNVIETRDMNTGAKTSETTYWPYGEIRTQTGNNPPPFGFCGIWGYYSSPNLSTYVRARYYRPAQGRWQTVDPLWPNEEAFGYADLDPVSKYDHRGTIPCRTTNGACGVFICDMHDYFQPPFEWIPSHTYMCVKGPNGGCAGGISMDGHSDHTQCCDSGPTDNGGFIYCRKIHTDCNLASIVCECIRRARKSPTGYGIRGICWHYPNWTLFCACEEYRRRYGVYPSKINCHHLHTENASPYYDGKLVPIPNP